VSYFDDQEDAYYRRATRKAIVAIEEALRHGTASPAKRAARARQRKRQREARRAERAACTCSTCKKVLPSTTALKQHQEAKGHT
jgi:predicted O-methyltransferase YrrM